MMRWTQTVETGHPELDRDHRQLIAMVNLLADALQLDHQAQAMVLASDLRAKAEQHCRHEQAHLLGLGGDTAQVSASHQRVADLASAICLALRDGDVALAARLVAALEESLGRAVAADQRVFTAIRNGDAGPDHGHWLASSNRA